MEHCENHDMVGANLIIDEIWPTGYGRLSHSRPDFSPAVWLIRDVRQCLPHGPNESQSEASSPSLIPISRFVIFGLGSMAEPNRQRHSDNLLVVAASASSQ